MASQPRTAQPLTKRIRIGGGGWFLIGLSIGLSMIPLVGPGIAHLVDRYKNRKEANNELRSRADWYRDIVAKQLGIAPNMVTEKDLLLAAKLNPQLKRSVDEVERKRQDENRFSLMVTGGATAASLVGAGAVAKMAGDGATIAKMAGDAAVNMGGGIAGGGFASLFSKERPDPQEVLDAINEKLIDAAQKGADTRKAVTPQMIFMLRATQDTAFMNHLIQTRGKGFHKMSEDEQNAVMMAYPALANASTSEAYAVGTGMMQPQELMVSKPNLNGAAQKYAVGAGNSSFADRVTAQRDAAAQNINNIAPAV